MNLRSKFKRKAVMKTDDASNNTTLNNHMPSTIQGTVGGAALAHIGCIAAPFAASALGIGLSGAFMSAAMYVGAPLFAIGITYGLSRLHGCTPTWKKLASAGAIALVISAGINQLIGGHEAHHNMGGHHNDHSIMMQNGETVFFSPDDICSTVPSSSKNMPLIR